MLAKKADGLKMIVEGCGGAQEAFQLLVLEHLEKLSENAASAISNIKFDKVVVWDGGANGNGQGGTAGFLQGLARSLPPMLNIMRDVGGIEMPEALGKIIGNGEKTADKDDGKDLAGSPPEGKASKGGGHSKPNKGTSAS